ncbi:hypothetical protein HKBW3S03_00343, partial [Candidatus Hakubella thermalkaliphila]|uniref:Helix-turn-helix domain-containing protein n=3 Tax=Candidatus Hakubella thermalkaliphila TaxID=2754717 RepID=A0A6V8P9N1_9ACTN
MFIAFNCNLWYCSNEEEVQMSKIIAHEINPNAYYTTEEAAELLKIPVRTFQLMIARKEVKGVKMGRRWRFLGWDLLDLAGRNKRKRRATLEAWTDRAKQKQETDKSLRASIVERCREIQAAILAERSGRLLPDSGELLNQLREGRDDELSNMH